MKKLEKNNFQMTFENAQKIKLPDVRKIQAGLLMKRLEEEREKRIEHRKAAALSTDSRETEEMNLVSQGEGDNGIIVESGSNIVLENHIQNANIFKLKNEVKGCQRLWVRLKMICFCWRKYKKVPEEARKPRV